MIRAAGPEDFDAVMFLLRLMYDESGLAAVDEARAQAYVRKVMDPQQGAVMLAIDGEHVVGTIGVLTSQPFPYSSDWWLLETWFFVHPGFREGTEHGTQLAAAAAQASRDLQLPFLAAVTGREKHDGKLRLYRKHFRQVGAIFVCEGEAA